MAEILEVKIGGVWRVLVPLPGAALYMACEQAIRIYCPECGALALQPCKNSRGLAVLTGSMLETVRRLAVHDRIETPQLQKLRDRLERLHSTRATVHVERKKLYRKNPVVQRRVDRPGRRPSLSASTVSELATLCDYEQKRDQEAAE